MRTHQSTWDTSVPYTLAAHTSEVDTSAVDTVADTAGGIESTSRKRKRRIFETRRLRFRLVAPYHGN
jgi:hypothetical protein